MTSVPPHKELKDFSLADLTELGVEALTPVQRHELETAVKDFVTSVRQALTPAVLDDIQQMSEWIEHQRDVGMTPGISRLTINDARLLGKLARKRSPGKVGRRRVVEDPDAYRTVRFARAMKTKSPNLRWSDIAYDIGISERQLYDYLKQIPD